MRPPAKDPEAPHTITRFEIWFRKPTGTWRLWRARPTQEDAVERMEAERSKCTPEYEWAVFEARIETTRVLIEKGG